MKPLSLIAVIFLLQSALAPAWAADDASLTRLALCQDSWLDWNKTDPAQMAKLGEHFQSAFTRKEGKPFFFPKRDVTVAGLRVVQAFPESVGMGVGFSVLVDAPFDKTRAIVEKLFAKPLTHCDTGEGMRTCELEIAEKRTFMLLSGDDAKNNQTLLGCYYYYEK